MKRPYRLIPKVYRGVSGWLITGGPGVFPVSVFFEHESAARRTIGYLRTIPGYQIGSADWEAS